MPRYFFNSENGEVVCDAGGEVFADEAAARREAVKLIGALLQEHPEEVLQAHRMRLLVADADRGDLFAVEVNMKVGHDISDWGDDDVRSGPAPGS